ncbi:MAG: hypothetical protein LBU91_06725 [Bacteroidales bacterium]|jgi:hypothetical protein|nr:hypothetical protein [Bacteroidales bacterium]
MEIWKCIEILRQPKKTWIFSKDNTEAKMNALAKISNDGYPSHILELTDFLKDDNKEIRDAVCKTVIHLFKKIKNKKEYYDTLKHCNISQNDIDFYEITFSSEQYTELLAISSLNRRGHIREKAVKKLSQTGNPRAIQFLSYRLADWVQPIRQAALTGIENYKSVNYIDSLIKNLPVFEWLQKVERTNLNGVYHEIIDFIVSTNRDFVTANFRKYPDNLRLILAKHISASLTNCSIELNLFLDDKLFLIRSLFVKHFDKLEQNAINRLLIDKSAKVRLQTLYCLKGRNDFANIIKNYLADNSATIRYFARFTLRQANFAEFYKQNLINGNQIIGSLAGLAEIDAKQVADTVKTFLNNDRIKVRKAAFCALQKLDDESAYRFALINLDSHYIGLRNIIINFLAARPRQEVLEKARELYKTGEYELRKSMLKLFSKIGGWEAIPDLMTGTVDRDDNIRQLAFEYLQIWKVKAARLFLSPKQGEIEKARQVFQSTHKIHEDKQYFKSNPLDGLDFYFR